jgi:hypothetical protein
MTATRETISRSSPQPSRARRGASAHRVAQRFGNQALQHLLRARLARHVIPTVDWYNTNLKPKDEAVKRAA